MNHESFQEQLISLEEKLVNHPVFKSIESKESLVIFMENHIFAVWDFMSLVKRLQNEFCSNTVPWLPPENREACRLINEINLGEECDENLSGGHASHYDIYLEAMQEMGARVDKIREFVELQRSHISLEDSFNRIDAPEFIRKFVSYTIDVAKNGSVFSVMGCFFYGRENIIPHMFSRLLEDWGIEESEAPAITYYLRRHIELDADAHGPAAERIVNALLENRPEERSNYLSSAVTSLQKRIELWDGIYNEIDNYFRCSLNSRSLSGFRKA